MTVYLLSTKLFTTIGGKLLQHKKSSANGAWFVNALTTFSQAYCVTVYKQTKHLIRSKGFLWFCFNDWYIAYSLLTSLLFFAICTFVNYQILLPPFSFFIYIF